MSIATYPETLECQARGCEDGRLRMQLTGCNRGTPRREYRCDSCGRGGCIRARDGKRIGPVFATANLPAAVARLNDELRAQNGGRCA